MDSSAIAFEIAAKAAYRQSMPKAGAQLLEPIMKLDVFTPEDNVGDVIGDLNRRRGMISSQDTTPTGIRVKGEAPLSEMFGYIGDLRTMTSGRGQFSMEFDHYSPCPKNISEKVIAEVADRVAVMNQSRVVEQGTVEQIFHSPAEPYTRGLLSAVPRLGSMAGKDEPEAFHLAGSLQ